MDAPGGLAAATAAPRSAYLHVPFCRRRCGYCNFTLVAGRDDLFDAYLAALELELASLGQPHEVDTLFFGGGTPSHLPPEQLARLGELTARWLPLAPGGEWSVEANPNDVDPARCAILAAAGVTRLSLGVQSFRAAKLALLEREHTADDVRRGVELARAADWSVSLDLIFAAPGETLDHWLADLDAALALAPDHLSTYGLTFDKGAPFWSRLSKGLLAEVDEETQRAMYLATIDRLEGAGFEHYEVSNFALSGQRCRHNEVYWLGEPYLAFGPGAARFVGGRREINHQSTTAWIARLRTGRSPVAASETLPPEAAARERLVFGLRRRAGIDLAAFAALTGYDALALGGAALADYLAWGLLEHDAGRLRLTRAGLVISDALWPALLSSGK